MALYLALNLARREMKMRIGIDGRVLFGRKTGDRSYILNLIRYLPIVRPNYEFAVFARRAHSALQGSFFVPTNMQRMVKLLLLDSPFDWHFSQVALPSATKGVRAELLHVQYIGPMVVRCKFVTTIHDVSWRRLPACFPTRHRMLLNIFIPITVRLADAVITDSKASMSDIVSFFSVPPSRVHVIPLGVSEVFFERPRMEECEAVLSMYGLKRGYALYLGVVQPRKNLHRLVVAVSLLRGFGMWKKGWELVIAGKLGWYYEHLMKAVCELGLGDVVKFIGYVEDEHLRHLYACARVFVYPSLWEGFGLPVVEAMACGTPVVTSDLGALKEIAEGAALLVNPYDVTSLANAIYELMSDDELCEKLSRAGRERAVHFSWRRTAEMTASVYEAVLASQGSR
jgi:glycosyltransferase involved in cell wall biosynthesis